jgi:anti-sigma-K factor RskA
MSYEGGTDKEHRQISELLPWYVNGTIGERDRQRVDAHLSSCAVCLGDLSHERRIYQAMAAETGVEYMPAASLKRLQMKLDSRGASPPVGEPASEPTFRGRWPSGSMPWQRWAAASVAVAAIAVGLVMAAQFLKFRVRELPTEMPAPYYTVTNPEVRPPDEVIRAVFSPATTLVELQAILDEAQLRIVSGPTEAGVYSLAANSHRPVASSLALLRRHPAVRFAEATERSVASSNSVDSGKPP